MEKATIEDFYASDRHKESGAGGGLLPEGIRKEIGHFNVFNTRDIIAQFRIKQVMPYNRRMYYKISFMSGRNRVEYADKVIDIDKYGLLFASPKVPYNYVPNDEEQNGFFCIFTPEFLVNTKSGMVPDDLPIFAPGILPVFVLDELQAQEVRVLFEKMYAELEGNYAYKYDLLRNYVLELIHLGQKMQPDTSLYVSNTSASRTTSLFIELLERQYPITSPGHKPLLRTAKDYAERLSVHVNHLNKVIKEQTGKTTTEYIQSRIIQEAKILLRQTDWNISEIAYSLGFEEVAHFSNFFKKNTTMSPLTFRN